MMPELRTSVPCYPRPRKKQDAAQEQRVRVLNLAAGQLSGEHHDGVALGMQGHRVYVLDMPNATNPKCPGTRRLAGV